MIAVRKFQDVKSGEIKVHLPADFHAKKVEIIILPVDESPKGEQSLQELLLDAPTLTDNEIKEFGIIRDRMNEWKIEEF